jgi:hypothetical protein
MMPPLTSSAVKIMDISVHGLLSMDYYHTQSHRRSVAPAASSGPHGRRWSDYPLQQTEQAVQRPSEEARAREGREDQASIVRHCSGSAQGICGYVELLCAPVPDLHELEELEVL